MKVKLFSILFILICSLCSASLYAQDLKFKKQKSYTKTYSLSPSDKISLDNQFGEMKLITWEKNEIKVDISMTGMSDDEARAQKIIDRISILDEKNAGSVSFKTKLANEDKQESDKTNKHSNESLKINYTVYLPSGSALNAKNHFGPMIIPDY